MMQVCQLPQGEVLVYLSHEFRWVCSWHSLCEEEHLRGSLFSLEKDISVMLRGKGLALDSPRFAKGLSETGFRGPDKL